MLYPLFMILVVITDTNSGRSVEAYVTGWPPSSSSGESHIDEYIANFTVPSNFGNPGAILVTNNYNREFYLVEIVLHGFNHEPLYFPAYSWIHSIKDNSQNRIIFRNHVKLSIFVSYFLNFPFIYVTWTLILMSDNGIC